jgi:uncharacterized membrane protein
MKASKTTSVALAVAAASLFAFAPVASQAGNDAKVHCYGINNCKGQNDCKSLFSSCKGQSACKGKGFKDVTLKECRDMGGKLESEVMKN